MRVLEKNEIAEVSGGTFGIITGLLGLLFGRGCNPAPACPPPAPVCPPKKPSKGC